MLTRTSLCVSLLALLVLSAADAMAANLHFVGRPTAAADGETVVVTGKVAGLGNEDITVTVEVDGEVVVFSINPGGNEPPGQNKEPFSAVESQTFVPSDDNGHFTFTIVVDLSEAIQAAVDAHEVPNPNWEKEAGPVTLDSATVTVTQGDQTISRTINL